MNKTQDIVLSNKYPAYILASAGTGKTELIARKVEHLIINENVDIDKIALITFTNKATAETTERIKNKLYSAWQSGTAGFYQYLRNLRALKCACKRSSRLF